jgi:hypothetical protein
MDVKIKFEAGSSWPCLLFKIPVYLVFQLLKRSFQITRPSKSIVSSTPVETNECQGIDIGAMTSWAILYQK